MGIYREWIPRIEGPLWGVPSKRSSLGFRVSLLWYIAGLPTYGNTHMSGMYSTTTANCVPLSNCSVGA